MKYIEGFQEIVFPDEWDTIKLDDHPYYRKISGRGLKSVDFMAIHEDWGLMLIEIKDYSHRGIPPDDIQDILDEKYHDSIRLIRAVHRYISKNWYYKLCYQWMNIRLLHLKEWDIWLKAYDHVKMERVTSVNAIKKT